MGKESVLTGIADALIDGNFWKKKRTRREVMGDGTRFALALTTALSATESVISIASPYYNLLLGNPEFDKQHTLTTTTYSPESLKKTHCIVLGDSIAKGIIDGQPTFAGTEWAKDLINEYFHSTWHYQNFAVHKSKISAVPGQLVKAESYMKTKVKPGESIDIIVSIGGNDVGQALASEAKKGDTSNLLHGKMDLGIIPIAHGTLQEIGTYQSKLTQLLTQITSLRQKGYNIERIFLEGLPDMGLTDKLTLLDDKGNVSLEVDLGNNQTLRRLARNISLLINQAMSEAITHTHAPIDILLIDNFHTIPQGQIRGLHPTKNGQYTIGKEHLGRSFATFADGTKSFLQQLLTEHAQV